MSNKTNLMYIKSQLLSMYNKESDALKRENIAHLTYLLDELILDKNRVSKDEILREVEIYSEYMFELKMIYYVLKGALRGKVGGEK